LYNALTNARLISGETPVGHSGIRFQRQLIGLG
jgi:hypothetical protein